MMRAKLVSKQQYLQSTGKRLMLYTSALAIMGASLAIMGAGAFLDLGPSIDKKGPVIVIVIVGIAGHILGAGAKIYLKAKKMEPVLPITQQNAHLLPVEETLVRGSSVPETQAQTELLRAAGKGAETPAEQLLRPTENR